MSTLIFNNILYTKIVKLAIEYFKAVKSTLFTYLSVFSYTLVNSIHLFLGNILELFNFHIEHWEYIGALFACITAIFGAIYMYFNIKNGKVTYFKSMVDLEKSKEDLIRSRTENEILKNKNELTKLEIEKVQIENEINRFISEYHSYEESAHKQKEFYQKAKELADKYITTLTPEAIEFKKQIEQEYQKLFPKK